MNNVTSESAWPTARVITVAAFIVAAFSIYMTAFRHPMGAILSLLSDDAFYYLKVADNIVRGNGCTFDGIAPTNGFHPLWMLVAVVIQWLPGDSLTFPVLVLISLNVVIYAAMIALVYRMVERFTAPGFGLVTVAACLTPVVFMAMTNGLETGLQMLAVVALLWTCYDRHLLDPMARPASAFSLGVILGFVTLCRLDGVFLFVAAMIMTVAAALRIAPRAMVVRGFWLGIGFALLLVPYFAWNLVLFGHLTPISGAVKSSFPAIREHAFTVDGDRRFGALMLLLTIAMNGVVFAADRARRGDWRSLLSSPVVLITLGCALHFLNASLFMDWGVYWWHFALYALALAISLAKFAGWIAGARRTFRIVVVAGSTVVMLAASIAYQTRVLTIKGHQHAGWLAAAQWAHDSTPDGTVFAVSDGGLFSYFSERPVINLDGKANGYDYLHALEAGDVTAYLTRTGTRYIGNPGGAYRDGQLAISLYRVNQPNLKLRMPAEAEVFRSQPIPSAVGRIGAASPTHFFIWAFNPDQ